MTVVRMARLRALVLDRDVPRVLAGIAALGKAEILPPQTLPEWESGMLDAAGGDNLLPRLAAAAKRAGDLARSLGVESEPDGAPALVGDADALAAAERDLAEVEAALRSVDGRKAEAEAHLADLKALADTLRELRDVDIDVASLRSLSFLEIANARLPAENLPRLVQALEARPVLLLELGVEASRAGVLLAFPRSEAASVQAALDALFGERAELPADVSGIPIRALPGIQDEIAGLDVELRRLALEREAIAVAHRRRLAGLTDQLRASRRVADLERLTAASGRARLFSAWIPASAEKRVVETLEEATGGAAVVQVEPADPGRRDGPPVPTQLANPPLLRPFEALVNMYGRPAYGEADPTPIVALSFVVMFGMMFGDLGQGAILFLIGLVMRLKSPSLREPSVIVRLCAGSSMLFGLAYGDLFGTHFMHPLWLKPMEDTMQFLLQTAVFGVGFMTLGLLLNLGNAIRTRDWGDLLFGKNGLAGIWFYWGTLLAFLVLGVAFSWIAVLVLWLVPMVLMFFKEPLTHLLQRRKHLIEGTRGEFLVGAFFELFETVIGYLSNTISFVRLAAFALNHAGLFTVVFLLAKMAGGGSADRWVDALVIVLGNVFIIGLEGLVVTIQSLRLEYYEFFSKFYWRMRTPFRPVNLREEV